MSTSNWNMYSINKITMAVSVKLILTDSTLFVRAKMSKEPRYDKNASIFSSMVTKNWPYEQVFILGLKILCSPVLLRTDGRTEVICWGCFTPRSSAQTHPYWVNQAKIVEHIVCSVKFRNTVCGFIVRYFCADWNIHSVQLVVASSENHHKLVIQKSLLNSSAIYNYFYLLYVKDKCTGWPIFIALLVN